MRVTKTSRKKDSQRKNCFQHQIFLTKRQKFDENEINQIFMWTDNNGLEQWKFIEKLNKQLKSKKRSYCDSQKTNNHLNNKQTPYTIYKNFESRLHFSPKIFSNLKNNTIKKPQMFLQSQKDIDDQKPQHQAAVILRNLKPKLISSLNYEQEYLIRRKQKRNNRRGTRQKTRTDQGEEQSSVFFQKTIDHKEEKDDGQIENNFYKEVYDGNDKISGYWVKGLLQGQAEIQYQNGDYFKGRFQKGYKAEGLMVFKDQGSYTGWFYNEQFHGRGVLRLKEKTISAEWVNGLVEGNCVVQYKNGNVYYGPLKQFKKHGYGYLYFPNDTKFFGQFVQGAIKGYGEYYEKGKLKCKGIWKNGKLVQEKKEEDWSYNFEEQNINWELIEEIFDTKTKGALQSCFDIFNMKLQKTQDRILEDENFKKMLESLKTSSRKPNQQETTEQTNEAEDHSQEKTQDEEQEQEQE